MTYKHQNTFASQFGMALAGVPQQLLSALRANQLDYAETLQSHPRTPFQELGLQELGSPTITLTILVDDAVVHESTAHPVVIAVILVSLASLLPSADSSVTRCTLVRTFSALHEQTDDIAERVEGLPCGSEDREVLTEGAEQAERSSISEDTQAL